MKNLNLNLNLKLMAIILFGFSVIQGSAFAEEAFVAGKDYEIVAPKSITEPLVEEFFNYACGHCYGMEEFMSNLKKNNPSLKVKLIPVELRDAWKIYSKAYFIGEKLNILDKSHGKIFYQIHVEKKHFNSESDMKTFFLALGVTEKDYDDVANSYWLKTQLRSAKQYSFKNKVMATPSFLVNKRYRLKNSELGSLKRVEAAIVSLSGLKANLK